MNRELLLIGLAALLGGTLAWLVAPVRIATTLGPAWRRERRAWRGLIAPLIVIAFATALVLGWAVQEPAVSDERLAPIAWIIAAAVLALWVRALWRFWRAATARTSAPLAVVGLWRPRIVIESSFEDTLDRDALLAALAHEAAHVRHRDPLRIALAQLAIDLQWPWPQPRARLRAWHIALEQARDDEAIADGARPEDLGHAIVEAARLQRAGRGAALTGDAAIELRITRLLDGRVPERPGASLVFPFVIGAGLIAAVILGVAFGEQLVGWLPGVMR